MDSIISIFMVTFVVSLTVSTNNWMTKCFSQLRRSQLARFLKVNFVSRDLSIHFICCLDEIFWMFKISSSSRVKCLLLMKAHSSLRGHTCIIKPLLWYYWLNGLKTTVMSLIAVSSRRIYCLAKCIVTGLLGNKYTCILSDNCLRKSSIRPCLLPFPELQRC